MLHVYDPNEEFSTSKSIPYMKKELKAKRKEAEAAIAEGQKVTLVRRFL